MKVAGGPFLDVFELVVSLDQGRREVAAAAAGQVRDGPGGAFQVAARCWVVGGVWDEDGGFVGVAERCPWDWGRS